MNVLNVALKFLFASLCLFATLSYATLNSPPITHANQSVDSGEKISQSLDDFRWAVMGYWGRMTNNEMLSVMAFQYSLNPETLYSAEVSYQLAADNPLRLFFQPLLTTVEVAGNFTYRDDPAYPIYEFNPYLAFRWANFPWRKMLITTIALGEGISYDSQVPSVELRDADQVGQRVLNYLMFEVTFALPNHPQFELIWRIHHRSGVFGLYHAENNGSTAIGVGMRYRF